MIPGTDSQSFNRYAYVSNNPIRLSDPTGHYKQCWEYNDGTPGGAYAEKNCEYASSEVESYEEKARDDEIAKRKKSRPIVGVHIGAEFSWGLAVETFGYVQNDYLFDFYSGTIYRVDTIGRGGYVGTPSVINVQGYVGKTNVYGIPQSKTPDQVAILLGGENLDIEAELGVDAGPVGISKVGGVSLDLDNEGDSALVESGAGLLGIQYSTESSIALDASPITTEIDVGAAAGTSTSTARIVYQIPWWPKW